MLSPIIFPVILSFSLLFSLLFPLSLHASQSESGKIKTEQIQATEYTLKEIYDLAVAFDKQTRAAKDELEAEVFKLRATSGKFLPQIDLNLSGSTNKSIKPYDDEYTSKGYQLSIKQLLFNMATSYEKDVAEVDLRSKALSYAIRLQNLITELTSIYFSILKEEATLVSFKKQQEALEQQRRTAKLESRAGVLSKVDLTDIEAQYQLIRTQRIAQESLLRSFYDGLSSLIGVNITSLPISQHMDLTELRSSQSLDSFLAQINQHNLDLLFSKLAVRRQKALLKQNQAKHYPKLAIEASHSYSESNSRAATLAGNNESELNSLGITLNMPIYHGGSKSATADQQQALLRRRINLWEQKKLDVEENAKYTLRNHATLWDMIQANKKLVESVEASYQATKMSFATGARNQTDLLNAQSRLFAAQRDYLTAQYDFINNAIEINRLRGTLDQKFIDQLEQVIMVKKQGKKQKKQIYNRILESLNGR